MAEFKPLNADHSIESVAFVLEFDQLINANVVTQLTQGASQGSLPWTSDLPAIAPMQGMVAQANNEFQNFTLSKGVQFAYLRPNGQPAWTLKIAGAEIRVDCLQYTRWDKIWGTAKTYIGDAFNFLRKHQENIVADRLSLQVSDKFVDLPAGYDLHQLLLEDQMLSSVPFANGDLWHLNQGWFETTDIARVLHNLNLSATGVTPKAPGALEGPPYSVAIFHLQQAVLAKPLVELDQMDNLMEAMHQNNKSVLERILTDAASKAIGLKSAE